MLNLDDFVHSIHHAIVASNRTIMQENIALIDQFFDTKGLDDIGRASESIDQALKKLRQLDMDSEQDRAEMAGLLEKLASLKDALGSGAVDGTDCKGRTLVPKTVAMEYPEPHADGLRVKTVQVPLIALVPPQQTQISQLTLNVEVQLSDTDRDVTVALGGGASPDKGAPSTSGATANLEITITPNQTAEGLTQLIKGYERALRSQLPG